MQFMYDRQSPTLGADGQLVTLWRSVSVMDGIRYFYRRANPNQHPSKDTHIYDAYHHDNGSLEPEPAGVHHHGKSSLDPDPIGASLPQYDTIADQSVLI